jgi:transposase
MKRKYKKPNPLGVEKISDIIPMLERGMTLKEIGIQIGRKESTMWKYKRMLKEAGFKLPPRRWKNRITI